MDTQDRHELLLKFSEQQAAIENLWRESGVYVCENLLVGHPLLHQKIKNEAGWNVVQASKMPFHHDEMKLLGFSGYAAPDNHPDYLVARRDDGKRLVLNLIDPKNHPSDYYFECTRVIFDKSILFIDECRKRNERVLLHCDDGLSKSPTIALAYLILCTERLQKTTADAAVTDFRAIYPRYAPNAGMQQFFKSFWDEFVERKVRSADKT